MAKMSKRIVSALASIDGIKQLSKHEIYAAIQAAKSSDSRTAKAKKLILAALGMVEVAGKTRLAQTVGIQMDGILFDESVKMEIEDLIEEMVREGVIMNNCDESGNIYKRGRLAGVRLA